MTASSWPRVTWSAGRTRTSPTLPGDRGRDDVLHLHRLEGDDRVAGRDRLPDGDVDGQDGARHRGDDLGRAGRAGHAMGDGGARRGIDIGRGREPERDAPAGEVEMDGVAGAHGGEGRSGVAPAVARVAASVTSTDRVAPSDSTRTERDALSRQPPAHGSRGSGSARSAAAAPAHASSGIVGHRRPVVGRPDPVEDVGPRLAVEDDRLAHEPAQEPQVRHDAEDDGLVERACQPRRRRPPDPGPTR